MQEKLIHVSPKSIIYFFGMIIGLYFVYQAKDIFMSVFLAVILMSALNPAVLWLERRKIPRPVGITLIYLVLISVIVVTVTVIVPPLIRQLANLVSNVQVAQIPEALRSFDFTIRDLSTLVSQFGSSLSSVLAVVMTTFSSAFFIFTLFVMSFYLLLARNTLVEKILWFPHSAKSERILKEFIDKMEIDLGSWVRGQVLLMVTIGLVTYIVLTILGVQYALPLAVLAGSLEILPNLGPTIAAIPAIFITFLTASPAMALVVALSYIVVQQFENNIFVPRIMKAAVNVEPITSMVLILIGLKLGGVIGALLSIPIYIVVRSAAVIYFRETSSSK